MPCINFGILWDKIPLLEVLKDDKVSKLDHKPRLLEAETAMSMGIPFDHRWYTIPVNTRAQMIASKLARISIDNLMTLNVTRNR
jgi:hypothetical protein